MGFSEAEATKALLTRWSLLARACCCFFLAAGDWDLAECELEWVDVLLVPAEEEDCWAKPRGDPRDIRRMNAISRDRILTPVV